MLNAAQRQQSNRGHNRVTSFSSETRRASRGRSTTPSRGPPQAGSSGARASSSGRSHSHHGGSRSERGYLQRQRSSSFTVSSERNRMGSGRVAHGTRATRGVERSRLGDTGSPKSRSDLGVGSRDAQQARIHSDALLSRHAMRNAGAGMNPMKKMFAEDGTGWNVNNGSVSETGSDAEVRRRSFNGSAPGLNGKPRRGGPVQRQRSTIITVRKTKNEANTNTNPDGDSASQQSKGRPSKTRRDSSSSAAGGNDPDGSRRGFVQAADEDSSPEPTTKALSYGPRKPKVSSKKRSNSVGHRRVASTGSTSAEESSTSVRKPRRRSSADAVTGESRPGGQTKGATATATAEAAASFLKRTSTKPNKNSKSTRVGVRNGTDGVRRAGDGVSSGGEGGESSSDNRPRSIVRRRPNKAGPSASAPSAVGNGTRAQRRSTHPMPAKQTPPKTGPTTKGTPAPPMAPARAASWNVAAGPPPPAIDASESSDNDPSVPVAMRASTGDSTDGVAKSQLSPSKEQEQEHKQELENPDEPAASESENQKPSRESSQEHESFPEVKPAYGGAPTSTLAQEESPTPISPGRRSSGGSRGWSLRIPSTSSSDYHVGSVNTGSVGEDGRAAAGSGGDPAGKAKQPKTTASKVFNSNGSSRFGLASARIFTSSAGKVGAGRSPNDHASASDSEDERAVPGERGSAEDRKSIALRSGAVQVGILFRPKYRRRRPLESLIHQISFSLKKRPSVESRQLSTARPPGRDQA